MGGRKQKKKINLDWATKEPSVASNYSVPARNLRKTDLGAIIFGTTHNTIHECLSQKLFGLPEGHYSYVKNIKQGLILFLFNYSDRTLHGIFQAESPGQLNINPYAWVTDGDGTGYTRYPAQVKVRVRALCHPLSENQFGTIIARNYYEGAHFYFELDHDQTNKLVSLFTSSPMYSTSKKWNNLYSSLLESTQRQEYNAPVSTEVTNLWEAEVGEHAFDDHLNPTVKISYASALGRTSTSASSSQPSGNWCALFKSAKDEVTCGQTLETDSSRQVNTTNDKLPSQEYKDDADFWQADTLAESWEESHWVSDVNHPVTTAADDKTWDESQWEESQPIVTTGCDVELLSSSGQHLDEPSFLPPHVDDDLPFKPSLSVENIGCNIGGIQTADLQLQPLVVKLMQEFEEMKGSQLEQKERIHTLEQERDTLKLEIEQLRNRVGFLETGSTSIVGSAGVDSQLSNKSPTKFADSILIVGGHDGFSWLSSLDSYFPSGDIKVSLSPMNCIRKYASAATLNGEIYHFGGDGSHTVESYNLENNQWIPRPSLYWKNMNVAGAAIKDRLFVVGGASGTHCSSEVEYLDLNVGKWLPARSLQNKRLAPAAAELNNVLYVSGGYDGESYLSSVERFDPRQEGWHKIPSMNARKGCHSMVVLNEKLYTIGGFSGDKYSATVEYLDPRMGGWVETEPMNVPRGNFGVFMLEGKMYTVGGRREQGEVSDIVECYTEGGCWEVVPNMKAIGKRSHFFAFVK